jgi:2-polyprenyl-6-methoxyphenol hydroxylase-like FAD-dependent oxidoreductase
MWVGCDGAHSAVRRLSGSGSSARTTARTSCWPTSICLRTFPRRPAHTWAGIVLLAPFGDGWYRAVIWDREREDVSLDEALGMREIRQSLRRIAGTDFGLRQMRWSTRFLSERRQADRYRVGRIFLAGDAAHVHSPLGALGINTGIQDTMNLDWKLSAAVQGWAPPWLLDSYHNERHPVGRAALQVIGVTKPVRNREARIIEPHVA